MGTLDYLSDNLVELRGPVNVMTGLPVTEAIDTCVAKLYDCALDGRVAKFRTTLTADAAINDNSIFVSDITPINVGTEFLVQLDDSYEFREDVTAINGATGQVTWTGAGLPIAASSGNLVTVIKYGPSLSDLPVDNIGLWEPGMNLEATEDSGSPKEEIMVLVDSEAGYMRGNSSINGVADYLSAGNLVKRRLGTVSDNITLVAFGTFPTTVATTVAGDPTWGFRGTIPYDHPDLQLGMRVRAEITLVDTVPTPDLNMTRKAVATIINS